MREVRWRRAERAIELDVFRCIREMIFTPDDVADLHLDVVDDVDEVENPRAVRPANRHVRMRLAIRKVEVDAAAHNVINNDVLAR